MKLSLAILALLLFASSADAQVIQSKACGVSRYCDFPNPVTQGDLLVVVGPGACNPVLPYDGKCIFASDSQSNLWRSALVVPNDNGTALLYALNVKGGYTTVILQPHVWYTIIAEYPPSTGLEAASFGTYTYENAALGAQNGGSYDAGWTLPIETEEPCELLISWGLSAAPLNGPWKPIAGPGFTVREYEYGELALEDGWATVPGVYIGTMNWNVSAHWDLGFAAFKMGGCK